MRRWKDDDVKKDNFGPTSEVRQCLCSPPGAACPTECPRPRVTEKSSHKCGANHMPSSCRNSILDAGPNELQLCCGHSLYFKVL